MTPTDETILREIREMEEGTAWPASAIACAVAYKLGVDRERVADVWRRDMVRAG